MARTRTLKLAVLAVLLSLLAVPLTATATHNSYGANFQIVQADEYDRNTGELTPDIPPDSEYHTTYHQNLEDLGLPARASPQDQVGNRYTDCTPWSAYGGDETAYEADLDARDGLDGSGDGTADGDACYIGYLDHQVEYFLYLTIYVERQSDSSVVSIQDQPYGPHTLAPSEENQAYCSGQEDPDGYSLSVNNPTNGEPLVEEQVTTGVGPADEALTALDRKTTEPRCGTGHGTYFVGWGKIDTDLLEAPALAAAEQVNTDPGSGTLSLPLAASEYTFLFGQPHPSNDDPAPFVAGQGLFGPNPGEGGNPFNDISGACAERTRDCRLLTPEDIMAYDPLRDEFSGTTQARVCHFQPQYTYSVLGDDGSIDRDKGKCGNRGNTIDTFIHSDQAGGFNNPAGAPTWLSTLPGWSWGVLYVYLQWGYADALSFYNDFQDDEKEFREGWYQYIAVNPDVPKITGPMRCVLPNFLTDGGTITVEGNTFADPGLYGTYQADAIDTDVFVSAWHQPATEARDDHHDTVRGVDKQVDDAVGIVEDGIDQVTDLVPELEVPSDVEDIQNRLDYQEANNPEPQNELNNTQLDFSHTDPAGLACDPSNVIRFNEKETTFWGGVRFNVETSTNLISPKDPTLLEDGLPANESNTHEGVWMVNAYGFNGGITAALDTNQDGDLDSCASFTGGAQPNDDFCPWRGLWDAYNSDCSDFNSVQCGELLIRRGYNVNGTNNTGATLSGTPGVGMYAVLKVSGPILISDGLDSRTVGLGDTTAQNCVVGVSLGFEEYLPGILAAQNPGAGISSMADAQAFLCQGAGGEQALLLDAFGDQSGDDPGTFGSSFSWYKLTANPQAVQDATGLGEGDGICVHGIWNVQQDEAASTTGGVATDTNELGLTTGLYDFSDCDSYETGFHGDHAE